MPKHKISDYISVINPGKKWAFIILVLVEIGTAKKSLITINVHLLTYSDISMGVILDENVTLNSLKQFPIVYLPNIAVLSSVEIELLSHYIESGGIC